MPGEGRSALILHKSQIPDSRSGRRLVLYVFVVIVLQMESSHGGNNRCSYSVQEYLIDRKLDMKVRTINYFSCQFSDWPGR